MGPKPDKKTGRMPTEEEICKYQKVRPIMNELLQGKSMVEVAEDKVYVTDIKGPLEDGWRQKVEAFAARIPVATGHAMKLKQLVGSGDKIGLLVLPFLVVGLVLNVAFPSVFEVGGPSDALRAISIVVLIPGITIWIWSVVLILTRVPQGELIATGPFALVKHPLYTGVTLLWCCRGSASCSTRGWEPCLGSSCTWRPGSTRPKKRRSWPRPSVPLGTTTAPP